MARVSGEGRFLKVTCPAGSFRRAGLAFGSEAVILDREDLTDAQLAAIEAEDELEIEDTDEEPVRTAQVVSIDPADVQALHDQITLLTDEVATITKDRDDALASADRQKSALEASKGREDKLTVDLKTATDEIAALKEAATKNTGSEEPVSPAKPAKAKGTAPKAETAQQ